jgi:hypothetical protein
MEGKGLLEGGRMPPKIRARVVVLLAATTLALSLSPARAETVDWSRQFGTRGFDVSWGVSTDSSGNAYVAGSVEGRLPNQTYHGGTDAFVRAFDTSGTILWTRQFGTRDYDAAYQTAVDTTGVYVAGETVGRLGASNLGASDAFVRKYDLTGTLLWTRQFGTSRVDYANNVVVDATQIYVVGATFGHFPGETQRGDGDAFLSAFALDGTPVWTQQFGTRKSDVGYADVVDATGVYTIGTTAGRLPGQQHVGGQDAMVHRFGLDGTLTWAAQIGTRADDQAFGVAVDAGALYVGGSTAGRFPGTTDHRGTDAWLRQMSKADGSAVWTRQFGGSSDDELSWIVLDGTSVYGGGTTAAAFGGATAIGGSDGFVRSFDSTGTAGATFTIGTRRDDAALWGAGGGGSLVIVGFTPGRFPGEPDPGGYDAFAIHATVP